MRNDIKAWAARAMVLGVAACVSSVWGAVDNRSLVVTVGNGSGGAGGVEGRFLDGRTSDQLYQLNFSDAGEFTAQEER